MDEEDKKKKYDVRWEQLRFLYHQAAMRCKTERQFTDAMYLLGILPGTVEFSDATRAWRRFRRQERQGTI
jgi:hypothetical protein